MNNVMLDVLFLFRKNNNKNKGPPDLTFLIGVDVIATKSIVIRFQEAETLESFVCTKFKVQWSIKEDFSIITGEREVLDMKQRECRIDGLVQGQRYYLRACAGNLKGYSRFVPTSPACVTPSSKYIDITSNIHMYTYIHKRSV